MGVHIRWMIRRDMPAVLRIESQCFEFPWSEEVFIHCLRKQKCIAMVAEEDDRVVGFMLYEMHKHRLNILSLAIGAEDRRRGIGSAMVARLQGRLSHDRYNRIMLEVRETNLGGQLFFKNSGFKAISILHGYYKETDEDAYLMQYRYNVTAEKFQSPWYAKAEPEVRK